MSGATLPGDAAERMDRFYRHRRHRYDLTRRFGLVGRDRLIAGLHPQPGDRVLELGCGTARNLVCAARRYPEARFFGLDVSREMLLSAAASVARAGLADRITLVRGDTLSFASRGVLGEDRFERVLVSYALSMIPEWRALLPRAAALLADGGSLHVVDFGMMAGWPGFIRSGLHGALRNLGVLPPAELGADLRRIAGRGGALSHRTLCGGYAQLAVLSRAPAVPQPHSASGTSATSADAALPARSVTVTWAKPGPAGSQAAREPLSNGIPSTSQR